MSQVTPGPKFGSEHKRDILEVPKLLLDVLALLDFGTSNECSTTDASSGD